MTQGVLEPLYVIGGRIDFGRSDSGNPQVINRLANSGEYGTGYRLSIKCHTLNYTAVMKTTKKVTITLNLERIAVMQAIAQKHGISHSAVVSLALSCLQQNDAKMPHVLK